MVVDDELISSRASDVETKTISNRKTGKEGPVADCIACSFTSVLYGLRLRVKGETQAQNVRDLLNTVTTIKSQHENIMLTFDQGYGKLSFIDTMTQLKFNVNTIATTVGSRYLFILMEELKKYEKFLFEKKLPKKEIDIRKRLVSKWILDDKEMLGSDIRLATRK